MRYWKEFEMESYVNKKILEKIVNHVLSKEECLLYRKVIKMEDVMAERASTPEHFIDLLQLDLPHQQIAKEFGLSLPALLEALKEIEEKIEKSMEKIKAEIRWLECTKVIQAALGENKNKKYFYTEGV